MSEKYRTVDNQVALTEATERDGINFIVFKANSCSDCELMKEQFKSFVE